MGLGREWGPVVDALASLRGPMPYRCSFTALPVELTDGMQFLRVQYDDWAEDCGSLSGRWVKTWHGAPPPVVLNIACEGGFRTERLLQCEDGRSGILHSTRSRLRVPFQLAYPGPLVFQRHLLDERPGPIWPDNAFLFCTLFELRVSPLERCPGHDWHFTAVEDIGRCVRLSALLVAPWAGRRSPRRLVFDCGFIPRQEGGALLARDLD